MLEIIKDIIKKIPDRDMKIHRTREFLQLLVLKILWDRGYFKNLAFCGGTCLRVLYGLRRFSEDLDFSLIKKEGYDFEHFLKGIIYDFGQIGFSLDIRKKGEKTVQSAMLKFKEILFALGLSDIKSEKLLIRLEIDSNPPHGWNTEISLVNKDFIFTVTHFDIRSLYATKLHACFYRKYTKGRDFYDLLWYLGKRVMPNFELLNNAIEQTEHRKMYINESNFRDFLGENLIKVDFTNIKKDVGRFIVDKNELAMLDKDLILHLI